MTSLDLRALMAPVQIGVEVLRNIGRRRLRSLLTIAGIAVGVLALSTMGALAEKMSSYVDAGERLYTDHVMITDSAREYGGVLYARKSDEVASVDGVAAAFPTISVAGTADWSFWLTAPQISATPTKHAEHTTIRLQIAQGRTLGPAARGEVVLGADLAVRFGAKLGDTVHLPVPPKEPQADFRSFPFKVTGILERTLTQPDNTAYIGLADGQLLLAQTLPPAVRAQVDTTTLASGVIAFGKPGVDLGQLARRISSEVSGVRARPTSELVEEYRASVAVVAAIPVAAAVLALLVGGLAVANTMTMAISDRLREVGLKKALGARTGHIFSEYLLEAIGIGLLGGVIGLFLGWSAVSAINGLTAAQHLSLFLMTPRLVAFALVFSITLGGLAGVLPALYAARLDPVAALRSQ